MGLAEAMLGALHHKEDFDGAKLDLAYITPQLIASAMPTERYRQSFYRMEAKTLVKFLNDRHGDEWRIWNLQEPHELGYETSNIAGSGHAVIHVPTPDHRSLPLSTLVTTASAIREYVSGDPRRVALIHCKCGKGRTGSLMMAYLMLFNGMSYEHASREFTEKRIKHCLISGVSIRSQQLYLRYLEQWIAQGGPPAQLEPVAIEIVRVLIRNPQIDQFEFEVQPLDGKGFVGVTEEEAYHGTVIVSSSPNASTDALLPPNETPAEKPDAANASTPDAAAEAEDAEDAPSGYSSYLRLPNLPSMPSRPSLRKVSSIMSCAGLTGQNEDAKDKPRNIAWDLVIKDRVYVLNPVGAAQQLPTDLWFRFQGTTRKKGVRVPLTLATFAANVLCEDDLPSAAREIYGAPITPFGAGGSPGAHGAKASPYSGGRLYGDDAASIFSRDVARESGSFIRHWSDCDGVLGLPVRGFKAFDSIEVFWRRAQPQNLESSPIPQWSLPEVPSVRSVDLSEVTQQPTDLLD